MGNASYRSGKKLFWEASSGQFTDAKVNKNYLTNPYHNGYNLPK
jgi:hypothetical protein